MTHPAGKRDAIVLAAERAALAVAGLEAARESVVAVVGVNHDATLAIEAAITQARVAAAKIQLVLRRVPS